MISFNIITLFPKQIETFISEGIFRIAKEKGLAQFKIHNLRDWGKGNYKQVDDRPYGGGPGMVLMVEPIFNAVEEIKKKSPEAKVILTTPKGKKLNQELLNSLSANIKKQDKSYIIICGHYEGFDQRIHDHLSDLEISIGDFVLSGGELPALIILDGITRLIPGVLGNEDSATLDSFMKGNNLDYPQYTRPEEFKGWEVPEVLLSGNHKNIDKWRHDRQNES
jgi:tRNA (guanine37-N1)-methyltransferase